MQVGGSSSSFYGMASLPLPERSYEDYYGEDMLMDRFPYAHFLIALLSLENTY